MATGGFHPFFYPFDRIPDAFNAGKNLRQAGFIAGSAAEIRVNCHGNMVLVIDQDPFKLFQIPDPFFCRWHAVSVVCRPLQIENPVKVGIGADGWFPVFHFFRMYFSCHIH